MKFAHMVKFRGNLLDDISKILQCNTKQTKQLMFKIKWIRFDGTDAAECMTTSE